MRTAADAKVVAKAPVVQVVLTLITRFSIGRCLILLITCRRQQTMSLLKDIPQGVVIRQHRRTGAKQSIRLNSQLIPGEMRRIEFDRLTQVVQRLVQRLVRQAVHQIEVKATKAKPRCQMRRALCLIRAVNTPQALQFRFAKALHADGDAVHARTLVLHEAIGFHGAWVGFHGDLRTGGQRQAVAYAVEQGLHSRPGEQARRSAANENRADFTSLGVVRIGPQVGQQMLHIIIMRHLAL